MNESSGKFHEGERAVQRATGEEEVAFQNAPMIGGAVMPAARKFLQAQRMLVVASRDGEGRPWASILFGAAGFVSDEGGGQLVTVDRTMAFENARDVLWSNVSVGAPVGILAIDLLTRRRLRINGPVEVLTDEQIAVGVEQAFPNCPKYIQRRELGAVGPREAGGAETAREGVVPDEALLAAVRGADTAFVASGHPTRGLDASHRGGLPGFIEVLSAGVFRIPDYSGNGLFNTLGNLFVDARCGLTILDFQVGRVYQMTGEAALHLEATVEEDEAGCTGRYWDFTVRGWRSAELPIRGAWEFLDHSPYNPSGSCVPGQS